MSGKLNITGYSIQESAGGLQAVLDIAPESRYAARMLKQDISDKQTVTFKKYERQRTIRQNKLLWALIDKISTWQNGGVSDANSSFDLYTQLLQEHGAKFDYTYLPENMLDKVREQAKDRDGNPLFRAVRTVETKVLDGKVWHWCQVFYGSSHYDTKEMNELLDRLFLILEANGIRDSETIAFEEEWRQVQKGETA